MKTITLIILAIGSLFCLNVDAQNWEYYTREVSINGEINKGKVPVLFEIELTSHILIKVESETFKSILQSDSIVYSSFSNSSNVIIWENVNPNGSKELLVYNNDIAGGKIDFCTLYDSNKVCYLNIKKLE